MTKEFKESGSPNKNNEVLIEPYKLLNMALLSATHLLDNSCRDMSERDRDLLYGIQATLLLTVETIKPILP